MLLRMVQKVYHEALRKKRDRYLAGLVRKGLALGKNVEIVESFFFDPSHAFLISIGDDCTICPNVRIIAHDASTKKFLGYTKIGRVTIRERCFIGDSALILPNVTIGPGSVIGAGSVVTRDIPGNAVAAGNPARVLGPLDAYLKRMEALQAEAGVFGEEYDIDRLTDARRREVLEAVSGSLGFIV